MYKTRALKPDPVSPLVWDGGFPWWEALRPHWWQGSISWLLRQRIKVWQAGLAIRLPETVPLIDVGSLLKCKDVEPVAVQQLESDLQYKVEHGQLPVVALEMLWESLTWGDPDWEVPEELRWRYVRQNAELFCMQDILEG
jgi:hypothetical protein